MKPPKTKHGRRRVTLPTVTVEALKRHRAEQAAQRLRLGLGRDDAALVFGRHDGTPRGPRAFSKEFARRMKATGLPEIGFHGLRHSHATALLRAGVHPKVAQERLGHSTVAVTLDLYSHVADSMQDEAAKRIDAALRLAMNADTNSEQ